jgi:hypothetical protein
MSLRVGCRWPRHTASTIEWFFQERGNLVMDELIGADAPHANGSGNASPAQAFLARARQAWAVSYQSAALETIALDIFGKRAFTLAHAAADSALLATELLLSPRLRLSEAGVQLESGQDRRAAHALAGYFAAELRDRNADLMLMLNEAATDRDSSLAQAWAGVRPGGALVLKENWGHASGNALLAYLNQLPQQTRADFYAVGAMKRLPSRPSGPAFCALRKGG